MEFAIPCILSPKETICMEYQSLFSGNENQFKTCLQKFSPSIQGPVVQSVVSLTSSLRVISLTVSADSIYNILIFFAEKM